MREDYYEPSEFEQEMECLKQSIRDNVRKEIREEIDRLRAENADLREVKENWQEMKREHDQAVRNLRIAKENAEREAKNARAKDILSDIAVIGYRPSAKYEVGPKCDKCDRNRYRHFISPLGREMKEECTCKKTKKVFTPFEVVLKDFYVGNELRELYYELDRKETDYDHYSMCADVYKKMPDDLSKINEYHAVFINRADCQRYCDLMNAQEEEKENERKT